MYAARVHSWYAAKEMDVLEKEGKKNIKLTLIIQCSVFCCRRNRASKFCCTYFYFCRKGFVIMQQLDAFL